MSDSPIEVILSAGIHNRVVMHKVVDKLINALINYTKLGRSHEEFEQVYEDIDKTLVHIYSHLSYPILILLDHEASNPPSNLWMEDLDVHNAQ